MAPKMPESVLHRVESVLAKSHVQALRNLTVSRVGDSILIQGLVSSYYHKQLAQEAVRPIVEGVPLINSIKVHVN